MGHPAVIEKLHLVYDFLEQYTNLSERNEEPKSELNSPKHSVLWSFDKFPDHSNVWYVSYIRQGHYIALKTWQIYLIQSNSRTIFRIQCQCHIYCFIITVFKHFCCTLCLLIYFPNSVNHKITVRLRITGNIGIIPYFYIVLTKGLVSLLAKFNIA